MLQKRRGVLFLLVGALLGLLGGCGGDGSSQVNTAPSGISGRTIQEIQGGLPSSTPSDTALPRATFAVRTSDNARLIMNVTSDQNGDYQQSLPPGDYLLKPLDGDLKGYYTPAVMVTVKTGSISNADVKYYILAP